MNNNPNADPALGAERIVGLKAIAERISARALRVSVDSVTRYARRAVDPVPVQKWGVRVFAMAADLDAWTDRQFKGKTGARPPLSRARGG